MGDTLSVNAVKGAVKAFGRACFVSLKLLV
jgi:hypothetical protein